MAAGYYSMSSSDSDGSTSIEKKSLDFSYMGLDTESVGIHLRNSTQEQYAKSSEESKDISLPSSSYINLLSRSISSDEEDLRDDITERMHLAHNIMLNIPFEIVFFHKLKVINLSNNNLTVLNDFLLQLPELHTLIVKNNELDDDSLPKDLSSLRKLKEVNISGNNFTTLPYQLYSMRHLKYLYAGENRITHINSRIAELQT